MNIKHSIALGFFIISLSSCYKDKGNYDYTEINDFKITLNPKPQNETFRYLVNQPSGDTLSYSISAEVEQTISKNQDNLEFLWIKSINDTIDSIYSKKITLRIPPNKKSVFHLICRVLDKESNIEYYQHATVKTEIPFHDSWFLLHGKMGDRKIGVIQWDGEGNPRWDEDMMKTSKRPQLTNATDIAYSTMGTNVAENYSKTERLLVTINKDSILGFLPFDVKRYENPWAIARPANTLNLNISSIKAHGKKEYIGMLDENKKFYWARAGNYFYAANNQENSNYQVDKFYINEEGIATMWDDNDKKFMHYKLGGNGYNPWSSENRQDGSNNTKIHYYDEIKEKEMQNKTVLWAGRGYHSTRDVENSLFIVKDQIEGTCYFYNFIYRSGKDDKSAKQSEGKNSSNIYNLMHLEKDSLSNIKFDNHALFATSNAFNEQLFYTENNELYRYVIETEEVVPLISFEGNIKDMRFRISNEYGLGGEITSKNLRTIGIVIEGPDGRDKFKEVYLDIAGDIINITNFDYSYDKIHKIEFSATQRRFDL